MIEFQEHVDGECYLGEYVTIACDDSNYLVWSGYIKRWTKRSLLELEWFRFCPGCGKNVEEEITAFLAEKGIT